MLKITLRDPVPYEYRNKLIHSFQDLGFQYEYIFSYDENCGPCSLHRLSGKFPALARLPCENIQIHFLDPNTKEEFFANLDSNIEILFYAERKN